MKFRRLLTGLGAITLGAMLIFGTMGAIRYGAGQQHLIKTYETTGVNGGTEQSISSVNVDYAHHQTHEGEHYYSGVRIDMGSGDVTGLIVTNGSTTENVHLTWSVTSTGQAEVFLVKALDANTSAATNGGLDEVNLNSSSTLTSLATVASATGGEINGAVIWDRGLIGAGQTVGGDGVSRNERMLAPLEVVGLSILSSAASNETLVEFTYYLEEVGLTP